MSLIERLENLSIEDATFKEDLKQFISEDEKEIEQLTSKQKSQLHRNLLKYAQDKEHSKVLYELLLNDPGRFLKGLYTANDSSASIIRHVILKNNEKNSEALVQSLFSTIRIILKDNHDPEVYKFYLGIYSSLVSHFQMTNPQHLNLFLTFISSDYEIQRTILVSLVQSLQLQKKITCEIVQEYLEVIMEEETLDPKEFLNFVITLELCFPMIPEIIEGIYQSEKTKKHILSKISSNPEEEMHCAILKLISASCIVENCRTFNVSNYYEFLVKGIQSPNPKIQVLSSVTLVKLWKFVELEKKSDKTVNTRILADTLISYLKQTQDVDEAYIEIAIEGMIYLTLYWEVRELIRMDIEFIEVLISKLEQQTTALPGDTQKLNFPFQYGILSIFVNLTKLQDINDKNTAKDIKNLATPKPGSDSKKEDQNAIKLFNRELLFENKIISKITSLKSIKGTTSQNSFNQVTKILYNLSWDQDKKTRLELVKQGALNICINYLVNFSDVKQRQDQTIYSFPKSKDPSVIESRVFAIRSLARLLISVDPRLAPSSKYDIPTTAIPFLKELLGPDMTNYTPGSQFLPESSSYLQEMTLLDKFESLLALTNIATNPDLRTYIVRQTYDSYLDTLILDADNPEIQKAAWELVANLISEPILLAKFFNIGPGENQAANRRRLDLVVKFLNSPRVELQRVVAGMLANATIENDVIVEVIVGEREVCDALMDVIADLFVNQADDEELMYPVGYLFVDIICGMANNETDSGKEMFMRLKENKKLKDGCGNVLRRCKRPDVVQFVGGMIKIIQFK
ncbi:SHE4 [[Candida] subhashii]|uniref:SHE4 n=1 Tax=[Candida] subhashii TaxID=561895 RepID=A0A8J5QM72_9ASCO|nr:SHE4 [[Candida] subhashii]KAG7664663.1 SHE4 [[Candida] subhashii]